METSLYQCDSLGSDSDQECTPDHAGSNGVAKQQQMYIWNDSYQKWHECSMTLQPPHVHLTEYEDTRMEIQDKHFKHIHQRWFYGDISRREAKYILLDYGAGEGSFLVRTSESYNGKFAISFVHEGRVKHVVIESKPDRVCGVLYHITPQGPFTDTIEELIEKAKQSCIIQNHLFEVTLTTCPPKPNQDWLHEDITFSQAEQIIQRDSRDDTFLVYRTGSTYAPYSLVHKHNGIINHSPIMMARRASGFTLNGVTAPVLYKLVHYFMENPIVGTNCLVNPIKENQVNISNSAIVVTDFTGNRQKNELSVRSGSLINNISRRSLEWCVGDHRGDIQKFFPTNCVNFLSKEELQYINEVKKLTSHNSLIYEYDMDEIQEDPAQCLHILNLKQDYRIRLDEDNSTICHIHPVNPLIKTFRSYKISFPSRRDLEQWYHRLEQHGCIPHPRTPQPTHTTPDSIPNNVSTATETSTDSAKQRRTKKNSCTIC